MQHPTRTRRSSRPARVGVGALGIVSTVTIEAVKAFRLHAIEEPMRVDELLADFDGFMSSADHVEFYWVPHTGWALTKRNRRTDEPAAPRTKAKEFVDDMLLTNVGFGTLCRVGRRKPSWIPRMAKILPSTGRLEYTDRSDRVFTSPRRVKFYEMEYAVPRDVIPEALNRVRSLVDEAGIQLSFPVEVRVVAPDDIPLSTAQGRSTGYIAVHVYQGTAYDAYFQGVERIMDSYDGRPHWGKMHFQRAETLARALSEVGRVPGGPSPARSRGPVHEPVPRARARPDYHLRARKPLRIVLVCAFCAPGSAEYHSKWSPFHAGLFTGIPLKVVIRSPSVRCSDLGKCGL